MCAFRATAYFKVGSALGHFPRLSSAILLQQSSPSAAFLRTHKIAPGNEYKVVGVEHWGFSYNAQTGVVIANVDGVDISGGVTIFSFKFIRADGGLAGRLGLVQHGSPNGNYFEFWPGTCTFG